MYCTRTTHKMLLLNTITAFTEIHNPVTVKQRKPRNIEKRRATKFYVKEAPEYYQLVLNIPRVT